MTEEDLVLQKSGKGHPPTAHYKFCNSPKALPPLTASASPGSATSDYTLLTQHSHQRYIQLWLVILQVYLCNHLFPAVKPTDTGSHCAVTSRNKEGGGHHNSTRIIASFPGPAQLSVAPGNEATRIMVYVKLPFSPGLTRKTWKRAWSHLQISRMCWVSILCNKH